MMNNDFPSARRSLKERIRDRDVLFGTFITIGHPAICEVLADQGFDFLVLDMEHGYMPESMTPLIAAASTAGIPILVRVPIGGAPWINMVLDAGAAGILAPQINDAAAATTVRDLARYPPLGRRGVGPSRATSYGKAIGAHLEGANKTLTVAVQIETSEAVANATDIAATTGLDMLFLGPGDLSVSLNVPGQMFHSKIWEAAERILAAGERNGLGCGVYAPDATGARRFLKAGFHCVVLGSDVQFLREGSVDLTQFSAW